MSQGGKLKSGGRGNGGRGNERSRFESKPKQGGLFFLPKTATATTTNNWLGTVKDWANSGELKHDVGELARPHQPGAIRYPVEPVRPDHDDMNDENEFVYAHREEDGMGDQLTDRGLRLYKEDFELYKQQKGVYDQTIREIETAKNVLHGKLEAMLSMDAKNELERIYTTDIWTNKDPEALIEAIKSVFVGQLASGGNSRAVRAQMQRDLDQISRVQGETQHKFSRRFNDEIEAYRHAELQAGEIDEVELDTLLNERELVRRYITACGLNGWMWALRYDPVNEPWPDTLAAAIKRANEFEEGSIKKGENPYTSHDGKPTQQFDLFQAFLAQQQQQGGGKNGGKGKSKVPDKQEKKVGLCRSFHDTGVCQWTQSHLGGTPCRYIHDTKKSEKQSSDNTASMTSAAVAQVSGQKVVAFGNNPDVGGGGTSASNTAKAKTSGNV